MTIYKMFTIICVCVFFILLCLIDTFKKKNEYSIPSRLGLIFCLFMNLLYCFILFFPSHSVSRFFYLLLELSLICDLLCIIWYSKKYFNLSKKLCHCLYIFSTLIVIEMIVFIILFFINSDNLFFIGYSSSNEMYLSFNGSICYLIHKISCLLLSLVNVYLLTVVSVKSNSITRFRNIFILVLYILFSIGEVFTLWLSYSFDFVSISISIYFIIAHITISIFGPSTIKYNILKMLSKNMSEILFVYDQNRNLIHISNSAYKILKNPKIIDEFQSRVFIEYSNKGSSKNKFSLSYFPILIGDEWKFFKISLSIFYETSHNSIFSDKILCSFILADDVTNEKIAMDKLLYTSTHDKITGLYTLSYFDTKVREVLSNSKDEYVMLGFDIKGFGILNDLFDRRIVDNVLIHISKIIKGSFLYDSQICFIGRDQFCVFTKKNNYNEKYILQIIEKIEDYVFPVSTYKLVVQVGIYFINENEKHVQVMCDNCFKAVNKIVNSYDHFSIYKPEKKYAEINEQELSTYLPTALKEKQFILYIQPQIDSKGSFVGGEALVRWNHPTKGFLQPNSFIPLFENNGLISKLDLYVWEEACKILSKWKKHKKNYYLSVNVSPVDFYYYDVADELINLTKKYDVSPGNLNIEITESAISKDPNLFLIVLEKIKGNGFKVEMDDFGSAYSSLNMLKDTNFDYVKLDMKFLRNSSDVKKTEIILKNLIKLLDELGAYIIAEGVETGSQVDFLINNGCDLLQGYYFSRPIPLSELELKYFN